MPVGMRERSPWFVRYNLNLVIVLTFDPKFIFTLYVLGVGLKFPGFI